MKQEEKYLQDLELLKKLNPIMEKLGVVQDARYEYFDCAYSPGYRLMVPGADIAFKRKKPMIPTYRLDTLLTVLPDWCWSTFPTEESICTCLMKHYPDAKIHADHLALKRLFRAIENFNSWRKYGAKEAFSKFLKACGELIILLDSEGIELKGEVV